MSPGIHDQLGQPPLFAGEPLAGDRLGTDPPLIDVDPRPDLLHLRLCGKLATRRLLPLRYLILFLRRFHHVGLL